MAVTNEAMQQWLGRLLGSAPDAPKMALSEFLKGIGKLDSLADVPRGTPVLVRGDLDCKPGEKVGSGRRIFPPMLITTFGATWIHTPPPGATKLWPARR